MASSDEKIIVVVGATGNQGYSVAHAFLKLPRWHVRCMTRSPSSSTSQALAALGAEIVQADLSDAGSLSLAFEKANAIFLNTDFWAAYAAANAEQATQGTGGKSSSKIAYDQEVLHGKNAAIAAAGVPMLERLIYSALPPMKKHSRGKYSHSLHCDSKATIVEYIEDELPNLSAKTSFIYLGGYSTNALLKPLFDISTEKYAFVVPLKKETMIPIIDPKTSTGAFVRALVEDEEAGTNLLAYDSKLGLMEITKLWSEASGKQASFIEVSPDLMHRQFGMPMERLDSAGFISEFGYTGGIDDIIEPSQLRTKVETNPFEDWLKGRDWDEELGSVNKIELNGLLE